MITLYTFGPFAELADFSPFVAKAMLLLKMADLAFVEDRADPRKAPKSKLPYIDDDGEKIPDSTFIRFHIEKKYGFDYDAGLTGEQRAIGWTLEKMCDDHLYWLIVADRWLDEANFARGASHFFDALPAPLRPLIRGAVRRKIRAACHAQGLLRHSPEEKRLLARRALGAASTLLGETPFLFGDRPHGADATLGAFVMGALCPQFDSAAREEAERLPNLVAYGERIRTRYFA